MKMKIIIILGLISFSMSGCSGDLLNLNPETSNVLSNYYTSKSQILKGVNAAYGTLQYAGQYKLANLVLGELPSDNTLDEVPANDGGNYGQLDLFSMTSANTLIADSWKDNYKGIQQCNIILNRVDGIYDMTDQEKSQTKGEMLFLRSLMYFNLVRIFGDVPLVTIETTNPNDFFGQSRTSSDKVYTQIITDLEQAYNLLPTNSSAKSRASQGATAALLGKIFITRGDKANSLKYLEKISSSQYGLLNNPGDVFAVANKGNKEVLFDVEFASNINGAAEGSNAFQMFSPSGQVSGAKGHNLPTREVYNLFSDNDKRKTAYFIVTKGGMIGTNKLKNTSNTIGDGGSNIIVLRYADVLLMEAECYVETNMQKANDCLRKVRERAGLTYADINDPLLLTEEIALERRKELINEGHRWFDLIRTNKAVTVMNAYFSRTAGYNGIVINSNNLVQPIPQVQIDTDNAIKQNKGYN